MIASVFVWVAVAAVLLLLFIVRIVNENHRALTHIPHRHSSHHHKFVELGKEREEFFAAGDLDLIPDDDYDIYYNS